MLLIMHNHHTHPLITRVQAVGGILTQNVILELLTELPEGRGFFSPSIPPTYDLQHTPITWNNQLQQPKPFHETYVIANT